MEIHRIIEEGNRYDIENTERKKTFDLLDALTKSGALSIDYASLHVVIAATHCFDKTLMDTVIQNNINPIEKVERSFLIIASTIQRRDVTKLIANEQIERVSTYSPMLLQSSAESISKVKSAEAEKLAITNK